MVETASVPLFISQFTYRRLCLRIIPARLKKKQTRSRKSKYSVFPSIRASRILLVTSNSSKVTEQFTKGTGAIDIVITIQIMRKLCASGEHESVKWYLWLITQLDAETREYVTVGKNETFRTSRRSRNLKYRTSSLELRESTGGFIVRFSRGFANFVKCHGMDLREILNRYIM